MPRGRIELRYRFRASWWYVASAVFSSLAGLAHGEYVLVAVLWVALIGFIGVARLIVRLTATDDAIRLLNWGRPRRVEWAEVDQFSLVRPRGGGQVVAIEQRDGRLVHIWASYGNAGGGTSYEERDRLLGQLESMRRRVLHIEDSPELTAALAAARRGDPQPLDELLAAGAIPAVLYTQRLHELAEAGEIDLSKLRTQRRQNAEAGASVLE